MPFPSLDTEPWAEEARLEGLRNMNPIQRLEIAGNLTAAIWNAVRAEIDRLYPQESKLQRDHRFVCHLYGDETGQTFLDWYTLSQKCRGSS